MLGTRSNGDHQICKTQQRVRITESASTSIALVDHRFYARRKIVTLLQNTHRRLVVLAVAAIIAIMASYAPVVLDSMAATQLTTVAAACGNPAGGC